MTFIGSLSGGSQGSSSGGSLTSLFSGGISGLASGLNTDSIVNGLVQAAQMPLVQLLQDRQIAEWQQQRYQEVNNSLTALQNSVATMKLQSTFMAENVTSSMPNVISATADISAPAGSYSVNVTQLAQGATISSNKVLSTDPNYGDTLLQNLTGIGTSTVTLTINNASFSFDPTKTTVNQVMSAITGSNAGVSAFYDANSGKVIMQSMATGTGAKIDVQSDSTNGALFNALGISPATSLQSSIDLTSGISSGTGIVEINGYKFSFAPPSGGGTLTLSAIESQINQQSSTTGVKATDDGSGHLLLQNASGNTLYSPISVVDSSNFLGFRNSTGTNRLSAATAFPSTGYAQGSGSWNVSINGVSMTFDSTSQPLTLTAGSGSNPNNVVDIINSYSAQTGVTASVDNANHLILSTNSGPITVSDSTNFLGMQDGQAAAVAVDAQYSVNGIQETSQTNSVTYNGLSMDLQSVTFQPVSLTVSSNTDAIVKSITDFVKQYNQTVQFMQGLYNERPNPDYKPLTSQQASQMSDTQVSQWNTKAQAGVLYNDSILNSTLGGLMSAVGNVVSGQTQSLVGGQPVTLNSLASIGIQPIDPVNGVDSGNTAPGVTTTGWNSYGLLEINTDKLTQALQTDPKAVMNMFTYNPAIHSSGATMGPGIAVQLANTLTSSISTLTQQAGVGMASVSNPTTADLLPTTPIDPNADFNALFGSDSVDVSFIGQSINDMDTRATTMQQNIDSLRTRYQNEFSQMESIISQFSAQSSYLTGMMGGSSSGG